MHTITRKFQADLQNGVPQHIAWNDNSIDLVYAAKAHCDSFVAINFIRNVEELQQKALVPPAVIKVLTTLSQLHALHRVTQGRADFIESASLTNEEMGWARGLEISLLSKIRPDAVALVDAFDWRDETLSSTIGCYDGNVYEKMLAMSKRGPMNKFEVAPGIKHIKAFTQKFLDDSKL